MITTFTQGIISYPSTTAFQQFLSWDSASQTVTFNADFGPTTLVYAGGGTNYITTESVTVSQAWKQIDPATTTWLFWELDPRTAARTFGTTIVPPIYSAVTPQNPVEGQSWFNKTKNQLYVFVQGVWIHKIRLFAASVSNGLFQPLGSGNPLLPFAGSQTGLTGIDIRAGRIIRDNTGLPIRRPNGEFFTLDDDLFVEGSPISEIRLEANVLQATARENIAAYQVVKYIDNGTVVPAVYDDTQSTMIAISLFRALVDDVVPLCVQGVITNLSWNWPHVGVPLWINGSLPGLFTDVDPHLADPVTYPVKKPPVARTLSANQIFFDQGLGGIGDQGLPGTGSGSGALASAAVFGISRLSVDPVDPTTPIAAGTNDPRMTNARQPLPHTHQANTITTIPVGTMQGQTVQENLEIIDQNFVKKSGDTMTGPLSVIAPSEDAHATTKKYVDSKKLSGLADVNTSTALTTQVLTYDGSKWVNAALPIATAATAGVVIVGPGLTVGPDGTVTGFSGKYADLQQAPTFAAVATSGNYNDLSNKPVIPDFSAVEHQLTVVQNSLNGLANENDPAYPTLSSWRLPDPTNDFTVVMPAVVAMFEGVRVDVPEWSHTFSVSKITDVYIQSDGTVFYQEGELDNYTVIPVHTDKLLLTRIQTNGVKVEGVYLRGSYVPVRKHPFQNLFDEDVLISQCFVPDQWDVWADVEGQPVVEGQIVCTPTGDLYRITTGGELSDPPAAPVYRPSEINGVAGFGGQPNGTCIIEFVGRDVYAGAFKSSDSAGIMWYFSHIAAGLLAAKKPREVKAHLMKCMDMAVIDWMSGAVYYAGMKAGGANTSGWIWEAQNDGTAGATISFPASAEIGVTEVVDNDITWKCIGIQGGPVQWYWADTDPTMRVWRYPDSHDSYAACLAWAVHKYVVATNDKDWLLHQRCAVYNGEYTYAQALQEIIYANLSTQIVPDLNLTNTFQGGYFPTGGMYEVSYLMDNCEVYAGYIAASSLYGDYLGDAATSNLYGDFANGILTGIESLYDPVAKAYKWEPSVTMSPTENPPNDSVAPPAGTAQFYPWSMSQAWLSLWGVPIGHVRTREVFDYMQLMYPHWWARNDIDDMATLGAHVGLLTSYKSSLMRTQVMERIERQFMTDLDPKWLVHDFAYYLLIRDNPQEISLVTYPIPANRGPANVTVTLVPTPQLMEKHRGQNILFMQPIGIHNDPVISRSYVLLPTITANAPKEAPESTNVSDDWFTTIANHGGGCVGVFGVFPPVQTPPASQPQIVGRNIVRAGEFGKIVANYSKGITQSKYVMEFTQSSPVGASLPVSIGHTPVFTAGVYNLTPSFCSSLSIILPLTIMGAAPGAMWNIKAPTYLWPGERFSMQIVCDPTILVAASNYTFDAAYRFPSSYVKASFTAGMTLYMEGYKNQTNQLVITNIFTTTSPMA